MKFILVIFSLFFLSSCFFGPVKELKYQIEDTLDEGKPLVEPTKIKNISQTKAAVVTWQSDLEDYPNSDSHLFLGKENLFTISSNGNLIALNHEDGSVNWVKNFNVEVSSGISGNDSVLVFTSKDGYIYCVNLNGKLLWRTFFGRVISPPLLLDDRAVLRRDDNLFIGINLLEGNIEWNYQAPSSPLTINTQGKMIFSDGVVYSGLPGSKLIALEASSGLIIWEVTISRPEGTSDIDRINDITSQPIIDNSLIFTVSINGDIACLDRKTAEILWKRPLSSFMGISDHLDEVIVVHETNSIYSLEKLSGKSNWRNPALKGRMLTTGIIIDDFFIVGDFEGYLHIIDINSGDIVGRTALRSKDKIFNNMIKSLDGSFFAMNANGSIYKFKLSDVDIPVDVSKEELEDTELEDSTTLSIFDKLKDVILD